MIISLIGLWIGGAELFCNSNKLMEVKMRIEKKTLNDALRVLGKVVAQISLPSRVCLIIAAFSGQRMSSIKRMRPILTGMEKHRHPAFFTRFINRHIQIGIGIRHPDIGGTRRGLHRWE